MLRIRFLKCQEVMFFKEHPHCPPKWLHPLTFPPSIQEVPWSPSLFSVYDIISVLFASCYSVCQEVMYHCRFVLHFLLFSDAEHLSFASCPSKGPSCPPPPSLSSWGAQASSPQSAWSIPGPGLRPEGPSLGPKHCVMSGFSFFFWDEYIYILEYNCFTVLC